MTDYLATTLDVVIACRWIIAALAALVAGVIIADLADCLRNAHRMISDLIDENDRLRDTMLRDAR